MDRCDQAWLGVIDTSALGSLHRVILWTAIFNVTDLSEIGRKAQGYEATNPIPRESPLSYLPNAVR